MTHTAEPHLVPLPVNLAINCKAFKLEFSWCNRQIVWQVLHDLSSPGAVPDIIVDDPSFLPLFATHSPEQVQQLRSLLSAAAELGTFSMPDLFKALMQLYAAHHVQKLHLLNNPRLEFELSTMEGNPAVQYMLTSDASDKRACFGVPLEGISTASLQQLQQQAPALAARVGKLTGSDFMLHVAYRLQAGGADVHKVPEVSLQLPAQLDQLIPPMQLPTWSPDTCLMEYAIAATDRVQQQLEQSLANLLTKLSLLEHLAEMLGRPLEVNLMAGVAAYYLTYDGHALLLLLDLPPRFPDDKPQLSVQSVRHAGAADSLVVLRNLPWSPRWPAGEMATRVFNFVKDEVAAMMRKAGPA